MKKYVRLYFKVISLHFSVWATKTKTRFLCQPVYSGCVLFVMKWCEHIINSQRKVTWSQRSIDRADSDVKWLDVQRAPSGPRVRRDSLVSHSHHLAWHTHTHTHAADVLHTLAGRRGYSGFSSTSRFYEFSGSSHSFDIAACFPRLSACVVTST